MEAPEGKGVGFAHGHDLEQSLCILRGTRGVVGGGMEWRNAARGPRGQPGQISPIFLDVKDPLVTPWWQRLPGGAMWAETSLRPVEERGEVGKSRDSVEKGEKRGIS